MTRSTPLLLLALGLGACSLHYTVHMDPSMQGQKLSSAPIAVLPISGLDYRPPAGCMAPDPDPYAPQQWEQAWNVQIQRDLTETFPNEQFMFLRRGEGPLADPRLDPDLIQIKAARAPRPQKKVSGDEDAIMYQSLPADPDLAPLLATLGSQTGARYAVVFVSPSLAFEAQTTTTTTYNPNGGFSTSSSTTTMYTGDIQVQIWDCSSGMLLYTSGGIYTATESCLLPDARERAERGANQDLSDRLDAILALLLTEHPDASSVIVDAPAGE